MLLKAEGPEELSTIAAAVDAAYANDAGLRRLRHFRELLSGSRRPQAGDLADRLSVAWIENGEHAWLFDNAADRLDLSARVLGFDMTALLDNPRLRTPVMMYLFHRIEERLDGEPTMILVDEGWKALDDEVFAARIRDWLKTLRKRNALVGFATQSARDALDSRIATALVEQTATMIFMPNAKARAEDYCDGFGLTEHELALIRSLPAHSRAFLVRQPDASVVVRLDLSGAPEVLTILSGRESTVRRLDLLREAVGDEPAAWYPALTGRAWPGEPQEDEDEFMSDGGRRMSAAACQQARRAGRQRHRRQPAGRRLRSQRHGASGLFGRLFGTGGSLVPALTILLTLYVALFAFALITGRSRVGVSSLTPRIVTLGLVLTFATSWIAYQSVVWNLAIGAPNEIAALLTGTPGNATMVFAQKIDVVFQALIEASGEGSPDFGLLAARTAVARRHPVPARHGGAAGNDPHRSRHPPRHRARLRGLRALSRHPRPVRRLAQGGGDAGPCPAVRGPRRIADARTLGPGPLGARRDAGADRRPGGHGLFHDRRGPHRADGHDAQGCRDDGRRLERLRPGRERPRRRHSLVRCSASRDARACSPDDGDRSGSGAAALRLRARFASRPPRRSPPTMPAQSATAARCAFPPPPGRLRGPVRFRAWPVSEAAFAARPRARRRR